MLSLSLVELAVVNIFLTSRPTLAQTVPEWMRSSLSNRLSSTGAEWAASFAHLNSGTYNNEWLVIDYDRFVDGKPGPGTVTVVDQIPGFVSSEDVTYMLLQHSYFASYNVPWDAFIFNMSGNQVIASIDSNTDRERVVCFALQT